MTTNGGAGVLVHHFSSALRNVVLQDEETRAGGFSCTKPLPSAAEKAGGTWCKGNGGIRAGGFSCTKSVPAASEKSAQAVEEKARAGRRRPIAGRSCGSL